MGVKIDPLNCTSDAWLWDASQELCDCPARWDDAQEHKADCNLNPIYGRMTIEYNFPHNIVADIQTANMTMVQTVISCAECGRKILAKDADVIYQASLNGPGYKYPHNIVKAVCPHHNRKGSVSYQNVPPTGIGTW